MELDHAYLVAQLRARGVPVSAKKHGEYLSYYGLGQSNTYVLLDGVVKASVIMREGREYNISYIKGPNPVSLLRDEESNLTDAPFNVRVESARATYLSVPRVTFWNCVNNDAQLLSYVKDYYRLNLERAMHRTRCFTMNGKTGAVGAFLYEVARDFGVPVEDGVRIGLCVTNEDIAGFCGISSRNSVNRILRGFREQGVIRTGRKDCEITVLQPARLERYVVA